MIQRGGDSICAGALLGSEVLRGEANAGTSAVRGRFRQFGAGFNAGSEVLAVLPAGLEHRPQVLEVASGEKVGLAWGSGDAGHQIPVQRQGRGSDGRGARNRRVERRDGLLPQAALEQAERPLGLLRTAIRVVEMDRPLSLRGQQRSALLEVLLGGRQDRGGIRLSRRAAGQPIQRAAKHFELGLGEIALQLDHSSPAFVQLAADIAHRFRVAGEQHRRRQPKLLDRHLRSAGDAIGADRSQATGCDDVGGVGLGYGGHDEPQDRRGGLAGDELGARGGRQRQEYAAVIALQDGGDDPKFLPADGRDQVAGRGPGLDELQLKVEQFQSPARSRVSKSSASRREDDSNTSARLPAARAV